ncbi:transglycosylase family protein [Streptomyces sp. VNUA24]|uniref:LysM peptidoglycan-binding domain-containing protein n=1 Tax=Streptomyces sp. VNUA24 TaxID=3031131 RepID=UPI0023B7EC69|nr:transglycosylase family protein [Streptomyces sp. VNUA24]WEH20342.1 transglycosylase family protein [Streptomyces sp. VNUA24]
MLSGNGRHRRPRQAPALLVAAGVTGSAIAIPLLGATGASAASGTTWDQVAECESGGFWSADTGNGRYGGLQLTQANWEKYGGLEYAKTADLASRSQQIAVAEKVLADQGVGVWSTCGLLHNLGGDSGSADVDTGVADDSSNSGSGSGTSGSPDSSASPDSADSAKSTDDADSGDGSGKRAASPTPSADADTDDGSAKATTDSDSDSADSTGSGDGDSRTSGGGTSDDARRSDGSAASGDGESGTGRHRGASADEGSGTDTGSAAESGDGSRADGTSSGRHASRDGGASREAVEGAYTVRVGDSLTGIVDSLGLDGGWRSLYAENERTVGTDPDLILPGQTLEVGAETGEK